MSYYVRTRISTAACKDFTPLYAQLDMLRDIAVGAVLADDERITCGTQAYIKCAGR
jgi:hypothetical protein